MRSVLTFILLAVTASVFGQSSRDMAASSGIQGGLVVYMGSGGGAFATDLVAKDRFVVHGLCTNPNDTARAREYIKQQELYGKASVQHWNKNYLPYTDNLVNLLVAEDLGDVPMEEVMRVLVPRGVACVKSGETWKKTIKPWPQEIDQWTHYLHGPDNNAVARDTRVGLPKHVQWIGNPKYARSHEQLASVSAMVSARGRVFCIIDEGLTADIRMPPRWSLVARDAFNGVILWKRRIDRWADHLHGFRSGPPDLPFRLVAVGDRVYVTLGIDQSVSALDAATGKLVMTYQGSAGTRQIIHTGDRLIMLAGSSQVAIQMRRGENQTARRVVMAANPETAEMLWRKEISIETLLPLVVSDDALLYQTSEHLVCLSAKSGEQRWKTAHPASLAAPGNRQWLWASPTLTAHDRIVYVADFRTLSAFSIDDGKPLWECSSAPGFTSPPDVFVIDDLLWRGYTRNRGSADFGEGLNASTGRVEKTIATEKAWEYATLAHHRCYRPKATSRFILSSRSGVEFIDVESGKIKANHWVRGTCQYGVMPANGLLYAPPHSCACNIKTMVRGTWAFASSRHEPSGSAATDARLEKGPAYGNISLPATGDGSADDWPTFRHDNGRSGRTATNVPSNLSRAWQTTIGGRLSSPVVSRGKLFVAEIDAHTVHALDMTDGDPFWSFTAGGRIDSPPTIHDRLVLFGATDGWVYCLREADGALVWRFRAAPEDRLIVARGQLESAWPIHGSVLVHHGTLIVAAGRSSYVDGGIYLNRLEPETGKSLSETVIHSLDPKTGDQPAGGVDLRGVLNDVLAVSGDSVYMRHLKIDFDSGDDLQTGPPHLFAPMGWLDDTWWHRSYWLFASDPVCMPPTNESGWAIWARMGNMVPSGRILSLGEEVVYGYGRDRYPGGMAGQVRGGERYHLFAAEKEAFEPLPSYRDNQHLRHARSGQALGLKTTERDKRYGEPSLHHNVWSRQVPIFARALVLADGTLLLAGPPEQAEVRTAELKLQNPEKAEAAFQG
ncbi:MAG: PQQ-binding-like beta-propeller repeat protein, partial [Candidatus Nealsonbacteria bacterium]|nr:PQQ-binding-like beta-propeller repeat protein [Candidatus Nealsonbacteria bacterium]